MRAILIAFQYVINPIPGTVRDLQQAYSLCQALFIPPTCIHLISDVPLGQGSPFETGTSYHLCRTKETLVRLLLSLSDTPSLFLYYSGHALKERLLLPSHEELAMEEFRSILLPTVERLLCVMDCCHAGSLLLPYRCDYQQHPPRYHYINGSSPIKAHVTLITSNREEEKAIATSHGSLFSSHLFPRLVDSLSGSGSLHEVLRESEQGMRENPTGYQQTVSLFCSYPHAGTLLDWLPKQPVLLPSYLCLLVPY